MTREGMDFVAKNEYTKMALKPDDRETFTVCDIIVVLGFILNSASILKHASAG